MQSPDDPSMRVSHETIYQSLYVYPRGGLKRELKASLRSGRDARRPRGRGRERGKIIGAVPIGQRPPEVAGAAGARPPRGRPGHGLGGVQLRRRHHRRADHRLPHPAATCPDGHTADAVADAVIDRLAEYPAWFARTLTWDNGSEMARHARITDANRDPASTSPTPTPPGSAAATRTSTACSASTSPRAPTCPGTPPPSSRPSKTSSTTAPANASASTPPANNSLNSSNKNALRRPPEYALLNSHDHGLGRGAAGTTRT